MLIMGEKITDHLPYADFYWALRMHNIPFANVHLLHAFHSTRACHLQKGSYSVQPPPPPPTSLPVNLKENTDFLNIVKKCAFIMFL